MTNNIKRLAAGFSALALMLGGVMISTGRSADALTLTENLVLDEDVTDGILVEAGHTVHLDLNGHSVTNSASKMAAIINKGTLTITGNGTVSTSDTNTAAVTNYPNATMTISGGTYTSDKWYIIRNYGTMTINESVVVTANEATSSNASMVTNGWVGSSDANNNESIAANSGTQEPHLTINGGNFAAGLTNCSVIKNDDYSNLLINGGSFTQPNGSLANCDSVLLNWNVAEIRGGNFYSENGPVVSNGAYTGTSDKGLLTISGGYFDAGTNGVMLGYGNDGNSTGTLTVTGGHFSGALATMPTNPRSATGGKFYDVAVSGGDYGANFVESDMGLIADGYGLYDGGDGRYYVIADSSFTIAFDQSEYTVVEGQDVVVSATLTPSMIGVSSHDEVTYAAYYNMTGDELANAELAVNGNVISAMSSAAGTYKLVATDVLTGRTAEATLEVTPRGSLEMTSKTVYAPTYEQITWEELGITATGEGYSALAADSSSAYANPSSKTLYLYKDNAQVTWYYNESPVGTINFKGYDFGRFNGGVFVAAGGAEEYYANEYLQNINEELNYTVENEEVAKFEGPFERQSGDGTYRTWELKGLKPGKTTITITPKDNTEIISRDVEVTVFGVETDIKSAQQIGTSQTFSVKPQAGYTIRGVYGGSSSEDDEEAAVVLIDNEDGTYTLTVNKVPCYQIPVYDEETGEEGYEEYCQRETNVSVSLETEESSHWVSASYAVALYEFDVKDEVTEEADGEEKVAEKNEAALSGYTAEILDTIFSDDELKEAEEPVEILLSDGKTVAVINDVPGLVAAIQNGDQVTTTLKAPEVIENVDTAEEKELRAELAKTSSDAKGERFVNIEVLLAAGDSTYGRITELNAPLALEFDVSEDEAVPAGYTRRYHVIRYHDGEAKELEAEYDEKAKTVKTESDRFSTYLIAYTDTKTTSETPTPAASDEEPAASETEKADETAVKAANTGVFTSEEASATEGVNIIMATVAVMVIIALAGVAKFTKR